MIFKGGPAKLIMLDGTEIDMVLEPYEVNWDTGVATYTIRPPEETD